MKTRTLNYVYLTDYIRFTPLRNELQMEPTMSDTLMILPASDATGIRLVRVPDDFGSHEVFRHVTGLIATVEEQ